MREFSCFEFCHFLLADLLLSSLQLCACRCYIFLVTSNVVIPTQTITTGGTICTGIFTDVQICRSVKKVTSKSVVVSLMGHYTTSKFRSFC